MTAVAAADAVMSTSSHASSGPVFVITGDVIPTEPGFLMGHGTMISPHDGKLHATVSGFIERVNKLISVRPVQHRYTGEIGDVVVARVVEVADKRWRVDMGGRQHGVLMLSSVHLPGGVQRRRTHEDSLQMRNFFTEGDLISAEVQKLMSDGAISLHTRNLKYGKLHNGQFLRVPSSLIKRCKQHFHSLPCGVDIIIGTNGYIWMTETPNYVEGDASHTPKPVIVNETKEDTTEHVHHPIAAAARERISRVRNCILALAKMSIAIYNITIMDVYLSSIQLGLASKHLLNPDVLQTITQTAADRKDQ